MDKSEQIVIPAAHYKCIQSNAHQCGILTRASRILMQSKTEEQAESVILGSMADLQLSGCFIVKVGQNRSINKFGRDLGEGTYRRLLELGVEVEKVHACDDFIVIRTPGMHLLVALEEGDPVLRDLMQDNLAIFADTFQAWLDSHHDELRNKEQALHDKLRYADKMNELVQCISLFNSHLAEGNRDIYQELLSGCIAKFPYLALEADQEDAILDLVERAKQRQEQHLEKQIKYNDELKSTITRSIQSLLDSIEEDNKQNQQQIDQNIASVQLF